MQFEKREYPEFAGKVIKYTTAEEEALSAIVVACDYHIGCTIIDEKTHTRYLCCCIGPNAPQVKEYPELYASQADIDEWDGIFQQLVNDLAAGIIDDSVNQGDWGEADQETCPFN